MKRPHYFYHVTPISNLSSIKKSGLVPCIGKNSHLVETTPNIFLFDTLVNVQTALSSWMGDLYEEFDTLCILEISLPYTFQVSPTFKQDNESWEWYTSAQISPENIIRIICEDGSIMSRQSM